MENPPSHGGGGSGGGFTCAFREQGQISTALAAFARKLDLRGALNSPQTQHSQQGQQTQEARCPTVVVVVVVVVGKAGEEARLWMGPSTTPAAVV